MNRPHPTIALLLWLTAAFGAGFAGAQGTIQGALTSYPALAKPPWAPPVWLYSPVWTALYALMGFAVWRVWREEGRGLWAWWVQLALGALWPWLFFGFGKLLPAFGEVAVLWLAILATILAFSKSDRKAAWWMVPALAWTGLETVLSLAVWRMNR